MRAFAAGLLLMCAGAQAAEMIELRYQDSEDGLPAYQTRILVTDRYLRMDGGADASDFVLFDRKIGKLVNVVREQQTIIALPNKRLPGKPSLPYRVERKVLPVQAGTVRVQVLADGKLCSETVAVPRLYPGAARAMAEYKAAMAYTQWLTYRNTPPELRQNCDLAHHVWQTDMALSQGLPIEERDYSGRLRHYLSGETRRLEPALFELPKGYESFTLPDAGEGAGSNSQP